jgi:uncharacterized protein
MDAQTGSRAVEWFVDQAQQPPRPPTIGFYGGEPLLEMGLMRELIACARDRAAASGIKIRFGATTNGTLLNDQRLAYLRDQGVDLIVSVDGTGETHNRFRRLPDGTGSFDAVRRNFSSILKFRPASVIRMTVNPETVADLSANLRYLLDEGFTSFAPVANVETQWTAADWKTFDRECRRIANLYLERRMSGAPFNVAFINDGIKHLRRGRRPAAACGAGKTLVAVSVDGGLYPCHRFVSNRSYAGSYRLGDVWSGLDEGKRAPFARYTQRHCLGCHSPCDRCDGRSICGGGCIAKGDEYNSNFLVPLPAEQYMYSVWAGIVADVYGFLQEHDPESVSAIKEMDPSNGAQTSAAAVAAAARDVPPPRS